MQTHSTRGLRWHVGGWRTTLAGAVALMFGASAQAAMAGTTADAALQTGGTRTAGSRVGCVDVEVNGQRSPSYDCLTNQLQPASSPLAGSRAPGLESEGIANRPGNQVGGQFNWSATSQRMGNNFGNSATPQRPATPQAPLIPGR